MRLGAAKIKTANEFGFLSFGSKVEALGITFTIDGPSHVSAAGTAALVRLRESVHRGVEVLSWRCFPPETESNCVTAR